MARRTKIQRYDDIISLPNVTVFDYFQTGEFSELRGNWASVFPKIQPVTLELACGKGEYSLALAGRYPDRNFIGIDVKGDRLWKGALQAKEAGLTNVHFVRAQIDHICQFMAPEEADEIWITFPDPYPRKPRRKKRLIHPVFLKRYARVMKPDGIIHLKTDSDLLYLFALDIIDMLNLTVVNKAADVYRCQPLPQDLKIQTYYEKQHLHNGKTIKYVSFKLNDSVVHTPLTAFDHLS